MYSIDPPSGVLDDKMPWYTAKVGESTWNIVKAKLTGKTQPDGSSYTSTVNLSDADADRLIENMKKDPRGYPQFNDGGGGMSFYDNYEKYQAWLVETYLDKEPEEEEEEIPEGLDDLLGSIQNEPVEPKVTVIQSSAIVPSKFFGEDRYDKYRDELTATGTIEGEYLTPEERREAFKKRNDKIGFQEFVENILDRKKSADKFTSDKTEVTGGAIVKAPKIDPGKLVPTEAGEETEENLEDILKGIDAILNSLKEQEKTKKKAAEKERKSSEKKKRKKSEEKLETGIFKGLAKATNKVLAPVKGLFERIFDFIKTVLLGRVLFKILEWIGDEGNREKLDAIGKFLNKTWPALLAAYLLFGNGLGRFITRIGAMALRFIPMIAKTIFSLAKAHPLAAAAIAGAGLFVAGYAIPKMFPGTVDEQERKIEGLPGSDEEKIKKLEQQKKGLNFLQKMQGVGAEIDEQIEAIRSGQTKSYGFSEGGLVPQGFAGGGHAHGRPRSSGTDTIPAMLTPGEFVMSKGAVQKYGSSTLASMNAAGGGTNRPKLLKGTMYAAGGGHTEPTEPAEKNRQTAERQPEVPAGDFDVEGISAALEKATGVAAPTTVPTATVKPTEPIIPTSTSAAESSSPKSLIATGAKTTYYDPSLGGINASGYKTPDGLPATSTGEGYRPEVFSAAAFPPLLKLLPKSMTVPASGFPGGRTLKQPFQILVTKGDKKAVVRVNDVGPGVEGHSSNHMLDLSVAAKNYFGTGEGFKINFAKGDAKLGPVEGSADNITAPFSGSVSKNGSGGSGTTSTSTSSTSSGDGGGAAAQMSDADLDKYLKVGAGAAFNYNEIRESLGVKTSSISRSSRPTSTAAVQQMQSQQTQTQGETSTPTMYDPSETAGRDVPDIDADLMVSIRKVQVLGITI
tara:strand:- start:396 stop:3110 length:2715 start_codon:yes stop_codon:yes gene_type:complete